MKNKKSWQDELFQNDDSLGTIVKDTQGNQLWDVEWRPCHARKWSQGATSLLSPMTVTFDQTIAALKQMKKSIKMEKERRDQEDHGQQRWC